MLVGDGVRSLLPFVALVLANFAFRHVSFLDFLMMFVDEFLQVCFKPVLINETEGSTIPACTSFIMYYIVHKGNTRNTINWETCFVFVVLVYVCFLVFVTRSDRRVPKYVSVWSV